MTVAEFLQGHREANDDPNFAQPTRRKVDELLDVIESLGTALQACGEKFREYEQHHYRKITWDGTASDKAARNREMAEMCERTIAALGRG